MNLLDLELVCSYVNDNIESFHKRRIEILEELRLDRLLNKNPYLFKAKNIQTAADLIIGLMEAFLSSSEEKQFGDFLEGLALFIAGITCEGHKSAAPGVDLEFFSKDIHYVVSIKSGPNWGNSSQQSKLEQDLKNAVVRLKQVQRGANVQPVLGICYGKSKTGYTRGYLKVVGQNFWYLISENEHLYTDIVEPIGFKAKEHNEAFLAAKSGVINRFTKQFIDRFCDQSGMIQWERLVEFVSGNFDLTQFIQ
jgi:hypothetical protein